MKRTIMSTAATLVLLSGCSVQATQDRPDNLGGKNPDLVTGATAVTVFLNADAVPNVAVFCIGPFRFLSTLNGENDRATVLTRFLEDDKNCKPDVPK